MKGFELKQNIYKCSKCGDINRENFYNSNKYVCKECLKKASKKPPAEARQRYYLNEHKRAIERAVEYREKNKQDILEKQKKRRESIEYKTQENIFNQARTLLSIKPKDLTPISIKYLAYRKIFRLLKDNKINNRLAIKFTKKIDKNPSLAILKKIYELVYKR